MLRQGMYSLQILILLTSMQAAMALRIQAEEVEGIHPSNVIAREHEMLTEEDVFNNKLGVKDLYQGGQKVTADNVVVSGTPTKAGYNIMLGTIQVEDENGSYLKKGAEWLQSIYDKNSEVCKIHGHRFEVRKLLQAIWCLPWQADRGKKPAWCARENANFEKHRFMAQSLMKPGITHVLILDGDAVLVQEKIDSLVKMAEELERSGKDILFADEDWRAKGEGRINGGVLFAKATDYSKAYFAELVKVHQEGPEYEGKGVKCVSNDQLCLQGWMDANAMETRNHVLVASGIKYNFGPQTWTPNQGGRFAVNPATLNRKFDDPDLHIIHFMGSYKGMAQKVLKSIQDLK